LHVAVNKQITACSISINLVDLYYNLKDKTMNSINLQTEATLEKGFTFSEFERFSNRNIESIKANMKHYGFKKKDLLTIENYIDFSNILGVDSRAVKDIELVVFCRILNEIL
jgi:hypothetical protein